MLQILEMWVKGPGQGHKVTNPRVIWKGLISWVYMPNMKSHLLRLKIYGHGYFLGSIES